MKLYLLAAFMASAKAASDATDATPVHTVYNCEHVRMNVNEANEMIGNGVCNPEVNCAAFSYDLGDCWQSRDDICNGDSWYDNGRENFRCSTKTGGIRLGRYGSNDNTGVAESGGWPGACDCHDFCQDQAAEEGEELVAFDLYSGKCRCWAGTCSYEDSLPCFNGGDDQGVGSPNNGGNGDPDAGNNWRCPAEIYVPDYKQDCDGNDITFQYENFAQYLGDGFCDGGVNTDLSIDFAFSETLLSFNFNCSAFDYDGGDCELDCNTNVYWATNFVELGETGERINECEHGEPVYETEWTSPCDCYDACAAFTTDTSEQFLFDKDQRGMCRCWFDTGTASFGGEPTLAGLTAADTTFCGLDSGCQIYQPNREASCSDIDYTLGIFNGNAQFTEGTVGSVESWDEYTMSQCVDDAMCLQNSYSHGSCFDCSRFSTAEISDVYCDAADFSISLNDLDQLVDEGFLAGPNAVDTSTGGDNCACLNFCFSTTIESGTLDVASFYEVANAIALTDLTYAVRDGDCQCFADCADPIPCGTSSGDCTGDEVIWYSTVADLNTLER